MSTPFIAIIAAASIFVVAILYFFIGIRRKGRENTNTQAAATDLAQIAKMKERIAALSPSVSVEDKIKLADECMKLKMHEEALNLYLGCLQGSYLQDQEIKFKLAKAYYANQSFDQTKSILIQLQSDRTEFKPNQIRFLMAKLSEATGDLEHALHEYAELSGILPGEEARWYHGALLKKMGKKNEANEIFKQIIKSASEGDSYYYEAHQEWIQRAKEDLKSK